MKKLNQLQLIVKVQTYRLHQFNQKKDTVVNASSGDIIILGGLTENYSEIKKSGMPVGTTGFISKLTDSSASKSVTKRPN